MQITSLTASSPLATSRPAAATSDERNPWGFPSLDPKVAQRALDGVNEGVRILNRLIDRSIVVRTMLDRDLRDRVLSTDTVHAVELLTRARDYALETLDEKHLSSEVQAPVVEWVKANRTDDRITGVTSDMFELERAVVDLMDDDEGNVREEIAAMRSDPTQRLWKSIRQGVDGSIANLYEARDVSSAQHILRAAGNLPS